MSDWVTNIARPQERYMVLDAMGEPVDGVLRARETDGGIEVVAQAVTPEGRELVCSKDGGQTFDPVEAHLNIPGGMIVDLTEEV